MAIPTNHKLLGGMTVAAARTKSAASKIALITGLSVAAVRRRLHGKALVRTAFAPEWPPAGDEEASVAVTPQSIVRQGTTGGAVAMTKRNPSRSPEIGAITGEQIKRARVRAGLTQGDLAKKLGVSQPTIGNWEHDKTAAGPDKIEAMGEILELRSTSAKRDDDDGGDGRLGEASAFGVWVQKARGNKGFTVPELATKSGLSVAQLYNIENGRTQNPREETRDQLIKALGEAAPEEAIEATEREAQVEGLGQLRDFDPHDKGNLPNEPGIYVFYDVANRPIYVGESKDIRSRILNGHHDKFWFKAPIVNSAAYVRIEEQKLRRQMEQILIKFLRDNAVINKQSVDRG